MKNLSETYGTKKSADNGRKLVHRVSAPGLDKENGSLEGKLPWGGDQRGWHADHIPQVQGKDQEDIQHQPHKIRFAKQQAPHIKVPRRL